jgi:hypothetical protein
MLKGFITYSISHSEGGGIVRGICCFAGGRRLSASSAVALPTRYPVFFVNLVRTFSSAKEIQ